MHSSSTVHIHQWIGSGAVVKMTVAGARFRGLGPPRSECVPYNVGYTPKWTVGVVVVTNAPYESCTLLTH